MKKLITIADWAGDGLYQQEVRSAINGYTSSASQAEMTFVPSTSSSIHVAYLLDQVVRTEERYGSPHETVVFQGSDVRDTSDMSTPQFLMILLKSGMYVLGMNTGYSFSLIRDRIDEVFTYSDIKTDSTFLSRDVHSRLIAHFLEHIEKSMDLNEAHTNLIPGLDGHFVGHVDVFGNILTTIPHDYFKGKYDNRDTIEIEMNGKKLKVKFVNSIYASDSGETIIYAGTSGDIHNPYLELAVRMPSDQSAFEIFGKPIPGTSIKI